MGAQPRKKSWTGGGPSPLWAVVGSTGWPAGQFCLSTCLFLVEVVASRMTGSLLLLSCAFHTLGGALALAVALTDAWLATRGHPSQRNTFGWARVRTAGTLASAVFLSALCLVLLPEALRRVADPQVTEHALALMGIGAVGIPIHLARVGLHGQRLQDPDTRPCCSRRRVAEGDSCAQEMEDLLGNGSSANGQPWMEEDREASPMPPSEKSEQWPTLCLCWVVACLGPVAVLLYSLMFHLLWPPCLGDIACLSHCPRSPCWAWTTAEALQRGRAPCWLLYLDPSLAVAVSVVLLCLAWPALHSSALVLMQAAPEELDLRLLELQLQATEGVVAVRELHVWQLDGPGSLVATAHVRCRDAATCEAVMDRVQQVFCEHSIHAATVQPDLVVCPDSGWCEGCEGMPRKRCLALCPAMVLEYETTV